MLAAKVGWAIVGTGSISATVVEQMRRGAICNPISVSSRAIERAEEFGARHQLAAEDFAAQLRNPAVEAVYIALPHDFHVDATLQALDAGKHVLCEKPLAPTASGVRRILDHPRARELLIAEGFMMRHQPQWRWIEETVQAGNLGEVHALQAFSALPAPPARYGQQSLLLDIGCYFVHLSRTIFGVQPRRVRAVQVFEPHTKIDWGIDAQMEFPTGRASFYCALGLRPARRMTVFGSEGNLEIFNAIHPGPDGSSRVNALLRDNTSNIPDEIVFAPVDQYRLQMEDFSLCIREARQPLVPIDDALGNAVVIDALRNSSSIGGDWAHL